MHRPEKPRLGVIACLMLGLALPGQAASYDDPTWPCIQRKVERLSPGLMWPDPVPETGLPPATHALIEDLAEVLLVRRFTLDALETSVAAFAEQTGGDRDLLGRVFLRVFELTAAHRAQIIQGIGRYSLHQIELARQIDARRQEMTEALRAEAPDFDRIDLVEEQIDWDERIYRDRQQSLIYICETPVLLEKRLYALAQMLQRHAVR